MTFHFLFVRYLQNRNIDPPGQKLQKKASLLLPNSGPYLQIALSGEGLSADGALEGPVARVRAHVDLQRRPGGKVLFAHVAQVLVAGHAPQGAPAVAECLVRKTCKTPRDPGYSGAYT
jgi:hypothetical protein